MLDTHRGLVKSEYSVESEYSAESDSDDELPPAALRRLTDEIDVRTLERNHPNVLEDIQEHTLFLLRAIFDSYDSKGDKIVKYFRKNRFSKALQVKELNIIDCPEQMLRDGAVSESIILGANEADTQNNDITVLEGENNASYFRDSRNGSLDDGQVDPDHPMSRTQIDKYGNLEDSDVNNSERARRRNDELNRSEIARRENGDLAYLNGSMNSSEARRRADRDLSEYTHNTPDAVDDISILFEKGDGANRQLQIDTSDLGDSENEIVYYNKEDMTNFSKNLGLNTVKTRPLPHIGMLKSTNSTPKSKRKKNKGDSSIDVLRKYNNLASIYEPDSGSKAVSYSPNRLGGDNDNFTNANKNNQSKLLKNKLKKRKKQLEKQALDERTKKFKGLNLADRPKYKNNMAAKLARNRIKKGKIDYDFFLDYESPYAEYLPARYREWMPKEKKQSDPALLAGGVLNFDNKIDEVSHIYNNDPPRSANTSVMVSRAGHRGKSNTRQGKHRGHSKGLKPHQQPGNPLAPYHASKFKSRQPIILDDVDDTIDLDSDNEPLKIFNQKKPRENMDHMENRNLDNDSAIQSDVGPHLQPVGMDIEDKSEGTMRPLFNRDFVHSTSNQHRAELDSVAMEFNEPTHLPKNFATGEGIFDPVKQSEASSDNIELLDFKSDNKDEESNITETNLKINPLF
jgi:hypothetical protein